ncbi:MAG: hypothetical protein MJ191_01250 [Clostridium sp.]|nr:hypothetical protein [Clostridium sp.]
MSSKNIYLVFSKTGTMFSHLISLCTHEEYAHVSLSLDNSFTKMYSFGRINPAKVLPAGFVHENLYDGVFAMFPESRCLIYEVKVTEIQYDNLINEIHVFENKKHDLKYNILGTSLVYFNRPRKRENYYFCSEFVSEVLINSGIFTTNKKPEQILPLDLLEIENKTLIYEGYINKMDFLSETITSIV